MKTKNAIRFLLLLTLLVPVLRGGAQTVAVDSLHSPILGRTVPVTVILPKNYDPEKRYGVFYFIHFFGGNNNSYVDMNLLSSLDDKPFIVVTPSADTCWYVNSFNEPRNRYEDFLTQELFPYIDGKYKTYPDRQAIGGTSMGGYGGLMLGLKYPERFAFIADMSGAINPPFAGELIPEPLQFLQKSLDWAFGGPDTETARNGDVFALARDFKGARKPYVFMAIGDHDEFTFFIKNHHELVKILEAKGFPYEYHEIYAGHFSGEVRWMVTPYVFLKMREVMGL
jgi:S-formylglutathione hydrolase FrmB